VMSDLAWAQVARDTRQALNLLGYAIGPRCLPDETGACGATFREHAGAHLAAIKAVADHQLAHLNPPDGLVNTTYVAITGELVTNHDHCCKAGGQ